MTKGIHPSDRFVGYVAGNAAFIFKANKGDSFVFFVPVDFAETREELVALYLSKGLIVS
jgi:uncharacterized protein (UPF0297 family)